tara:strand:- start:871 stop:1437 length:567 start_codon:yes stop_codon:yes gene_type:complete
MNKIKCLIFVSCISSLNAAGGGWLDKWLTIDLGLLLWTISTFMVVLFILRWQAWGPLMEALNNREQQINEALNAAKIAKEQAEKVASDNEEVLNKARKEAQEILVSAKEAGEKLKIKLEKDGQAKHADMLEKAQQQINAEKAQALSEIKQVVVDLTVSASEKIIKKNLNSDDNKKIIEKTVEELNQAN